MPFWSTWVIILLLFSIATNIELLSKDINKKENMSANSINDIEMDHFGSGIDYLATTCIGPCIGSHVLLDNNQHIFIEHRSSVYLPPSINLATVRLYFQNVAKHVSDLLPTSSIT
jgi:hypothetical protein